MSNLLSFNFETSEIRVVEVDNEPWFVAMDIAHVLEYTEPARMLQLVDNEDKQTINPQKLDSIKMVESFGSNTFKVSIINESGLYAVIFGSTKPEAKNFKKWVTSEVLPSIRKDGFYINKSAVQNTDQLTQMMMNIQSQLDNMQTDLQSRNSKLESENSELIKQREEYQQDQIQLHKVYSQLPGLKAAIESAKQLTDEQLRTFTLKEFLQEYYPDLKIERGQKINIGRTVSNFCKLAKIKPLPKLYNQATVYDERFAPLMCIATLLELGLLKKFIN